MAQILEILVCGLFYTSRKRLEVNGVVDVKFGLDTCLN